jgi:hypothetical protein
MDIHIQCQYDGILHGFTTFHLESPEASFPELLRRLQLKHREVGFPRWVWENSQETPTFDGKTM